MRTRILAALALAVVMVVASAGPAPAVSHLDPEEEIPTLSFFFDPILATLYFDVFDPESEGDELADCAEDPVPDPCLAVEIGEPTNHGKVVSSFVHALKENPELWSGPRGHLVRQVAKSDAGKKATSDDGADDGEDGELSTAGAERGKKGPPPHAKAKGRRGR